MKSHVSSFMEHTIINLSRAVRDNNPKLTWAVLSNLQSVLNTYVEQAHKEMKLGEYNNNRKIKKAGEGK